MRCITNLISYLVLPGSRTSVSCKMPNMWYMKVDVNRIYGENMEV